MVSPIITRTSSDHDSELLAESVRELCVGDPDRHLLAMLAEPSKRAGLLILYAFHLDLRRIPGKVSETILGQIRLQAWRDSLGRAQSDIAGDLPLAKPLVTWGFARADLDRLIDTYEAQLLDDDVSAPDKMHRHAEATGGHMGRMGLQFLLASENGTIKANQLAAAHHAGTALALVDGIRALARDRSGNDAVGAAKTLADLAWAEITATRTAIHVDRPPIQAFPVLASSVMAENYLTALARTRYDPNHPKTRYRGAGAVTRLIWRRWRNKI